jgi:hypothetical protein
VSRLHSSRGVREDWLWSMPLARYFAYTGSVLLALLFLLDGYLPSTAIEPVRTDFDRSIIRLKSEHKWPSAVVFDTNQPTIVPPIAVAEAPPPAGPLPEPAKSPLDALATAQPKEPSPVLAAAPAAAPKRAVRRAKIVRAPAPRVASHDMFGFRNAFASW